MRQFEYVTLDIRARGETPDHAVARHRYPDGVNAAGTTITSGG
jgi:hypothetical protein